MSFVRTVVVVVACSVPLLSACNKKSTAGTASAERSGASEHAGFVVTELSTSVGALPDALKVEAAKAKAQGLKPHVEFWASWCQPCMDLAKSLGDPKMEAAFKGTYIIRLNADEWGDKLGVTGFNASAIPVFYELDAEGKKTGKTIDGGAWGENIPENMAPPLDQYFHGS
jgi:thiol-disulfide isomerase/thioredoxin